MILNQVKKSLLKLILLGCIFLSWISDAQVFSNQIDSIVQSHLDRNLFSGAIVQIKLKSHILHSKAYGAARQFDRPGQLMPVPERMTLGHLFDIASLTKVVGTTTSIMLLVDQGKIKLDDPLSSYISGFSEWPKSQVTIRHVLQHTAGLYEWYPMYYKANNRAQVYELIHSLPLPYTVGDNRRYSDLGFTLLGELIETVSGLPLEDYMNKNIFKPLGMRNTGYNPIERGTHLKIAATSIGNPYEKRMVHDPELGFQFKEINPASWNSWREYVLVGEVNDGNAWYGGGGVSGAAGIFSTVSDLQIFLDMLMKQGLHGTHTFISSATLREFLKRDEFGNGLGWVMDPESSFMQGVPEGSFGHTGFTGTSLVAIPQKELTIIILTNRQQIGLIQGKSYPNVNPLRQDILNATMKRVPFK